MTDINDIEQRVQKLLHDIKVKKNAKLAEQIFREPKQREAEKEAREREEAEQLKRKERLWNPWIEKSHAA